MFNKILSNFIVNDVKTKKPSYTVTAFIIGFFIINLKLLFSGIQITNKIKMSDFNGVDYAASVAALGGIYILRKNKTIKPDKPEDIE
jgi:hypothetical protein